MHVGFTGTRLGMTREQAGAVASLLLHRDFHGHHGDCIGADAEFDAIARLVGGCRGLIIHPSNLSTRAHCRPDPIRDVVSAPKDPIARDHDIVDESERLIATPKDHRWEVRSGTWTTVRYALSLNRPVAIVLPSGGITFDGAPWT